MHPDNVTKGGALRITTRRHCVPGGDVAKYVKQHQKLPPTHAGPCDKKGQTAYSSGRVQREVYKLLDGMTLSFTAKMPAKSVKGTRAALWAVAGGYCDNDSATPQGDKSNLAEYDVLEWYSMKPQQSTSSTHLTCDMSRAQKKGVSQFLSKTKVVPASTAPDMRKSHTFSVTRKGDRLIYAIDGKVRARQQCGKKPLQETRAGMAKLNCASLLDQDFTAIMQGEVFGWNPKQKNSKFNGPDPTKRFPTQHLVISKVTLSVP